MALSAECHSPVTAVAGTQPTGLRYRTREYVGENATVPFLLLIEDDDAIRASLELALSRQGHRVVARRRARTG